MSMNNLQKIIIWIFGIFFVWVLVSAHWYVCGIRGFCKQNNQNQHQTERQKIQFNRDLETGAVIKTIPLVGGEDKVEKSKIQTKENEINGITEEKSIKITERKIKCYTYLNSYIKLNSNKNIPSEVKKLEKFFNSYYDKKLDEDGIYDIADFEAVKELQAENNLKVDGQIGPETQKVINVIYCIKTEKKD